MPQNRYIIVGDSHVSVFSGQIEELGFGAICCDGRVITRRLGVWMTYRALENSGAFVDVLRSHADRVPVVSCGEIDIRRGGAIWLAARDCLQLITICSEMLGSQCIFLEIPRPCSVEPTRYSRKYSVEERLARTIEFNEYMRSRWSRTAPVDNPQDPSVFIDDIHLGISMVPNILRSLDDVASRG